MICFDLENKLVLVNDKLASLETLKYIDDVELLENFKDTFYKLLPANEASEYGLTHQGIVWALEKAGDLVKLGWPALQKLLKTLLPDTTEGWWHLGIDSLSLILDIIGPATFGLGNIASLVIDIIHGMYYIISGVGYFKNLGIPDNRDKEFEYIITGLVTLGFAFIPGVGNAGSIAFRAFMKKELKTEGKIGIEILDKLLVHPTFGAPIKKIFEFFAKTGGKVGEFLLLKITKIFDTAIAPIKWLSNMLGITKLTKWLGEGIDKIIGKLFSGPKAEKIFNKYGIKIEPAVSVNIAKGAKNSAKYEYEFAKHAGSEKELENVLKTLNKEEKKTFMKTVKSELKGAKEIFDKTNFAYQSIVVKSKMWLAQHLIGEKLHISEAIDTIWSFFVTKSPEKEKTAIKNIGVDEKKYQQFIKDYAFFLNESDKEEINNDTIIKIQEFLTSEDLSNELEYKSEITKTGILDIATIQGLRTLFEFLKETKTDNSNSEENKKAKEIVEFSTNAVKELDKIDGGYINYIKSLEIPNIQSLPKTNERLLNFSDFVKIN
jgi:hypothetical protein